MVFATVLCCSKGQFLVTDSSPGAFGRFCARARRKFVAMHVSTLAHQPCHNRGLRQGVRFSSTGSGRVGFAFSRATPPRSLLGQLGRHDEDAPFGFHQSPPTSLALWRRERPHQASSQFSVVSTILLELDLWCLRGRIWLPIHLLMRRRRLTPHSPSVVGRRKQPGWWILLSASTPSSQRLTMPRQPCSGRKPDQLLLQRLSPFPP